MFTGKVFKWYFRVGWTGKEFGLYKGLEGIKSRWFDSCDALAQESETL